TSEYVCTSSTAAAIASARSGGLPTASHAANAKAGRRRLPPGNSRWRIAAWSAAGSSEAGGSSASRKRSTSAARSARYARTSTLLFLDREGGLREALRRAHQLGDPALGVIEALGAGAGQRDAFLERGERRLEREIAALEARDERFEARERLLEARER